MNQMDISRRQFLLKASTLFLAGISPLSSGLYSKVLFTHAPPLSLDALIGFFPEPKSAIIIGNEYLNHFGKEVQPRQLLSELPTTLTQINPQTKKKELFKQIDEHIRRDFSAQNVVNIHGWVLAKTELTLCALLSLYFR